MIALIILNGQVDDYILRFKDTPHMFDNIYCADGGSNFLYIHKIIPKVIMGDMDSIKPDVMAFYKEQGCEFVVFQKEKDETDGQLIVDRVIADGAKKAVMLCALGGRLDHMLGNIQLLYRMVNKGISASMESNDATVYLATAEGKVQIQGPKGQIVSIIPYEDNTILSLDGFGYNVSRLKYEKHTPIGISNYLAKECGCIDVHVGCALVVVPSKQ